MADVQLEDSAYFKAQVLLVLLTGFTAGANTAIAATDTILEAMQKIQGQITARQAADQDLTDIAALTPSNDDILQRKAGAWANRTMAQLKTDLSLPSDTVTSLAGKVGTTGDETIAGVKTFSSDPVIPDEAYGVGWNGSLEPPTKNAVYDKIETLGGSGVGGTVGTTDNAVPRADGTGGSTLQASGVLIDDSNNVTANSYKFSGGGEIHGTGGFPTFKISYDLFRIDTNEHLKARSTAQFTWSSATDVTSLPDAGFARVAAGVIQATAGWNGSDYYNSDAAIMMRQRVIVKTSAYTLTNAETNSLYTNEGATALVVLTLPTAVAGLQYEFYVADADGIQIVAASGDTIRFEGTVSAAAGNAQSTTVGSSVILKAINATEWVAIGKPGGSWTLT